MQDFAVPEPDLAQQEAQQKAYYRSKSKSDSGVKHQAEFDEVFRGTQGSQNNQETQGINVAFEDDNPFGGNASFNAKPQSSSKSNPSMPDSSYPSMPNQYKKENLHGSNSTPNQSKKPPTSSKSNPNFQSPTNSQSENFFAFEDQAFSSSGNQAQNGAQNKSQGRQSYPQASQTRRAASTEGGTFFANFGEPGKQDQSQPQKQNGNAANNQSQQAQNEKQQPTYEQYVQQQREDKMKNQFGGINLNDPQGLKNSAFKVLGGLGNKAMQYAKQAEKIIEAQLFQKDKEDTISENSETSKQQQQHQQYANNALGGQQQQQQQPQQQQRSKVQNGTLMEDNDYSHDDSKPFSQRPSGSQGQAPKPPPGTDKAHEKYLEQVTITLSKMPSSERLDMLGVLDPKDRAFVEQAISMNYINTQSTAQEFPKQTQQPAPKPTPKPQPPQQDFFKNAPNNTAKPQAKPTGPQATQQTKPQPQSQAQPKVQPQAQTKPQPKPQPQPQPAFKADFNQTGTKKADIKAQDDLGLNDLLSEDVKYDIFDDPFKPKPQSQQQYQAPNYNQQNYQQQQQKQQTSQPKQTQQQQSNNSQKQFQDQKQQKAKSSFGSDFDDFLGGASNYQKQQQKPQPMKQQANDFFQNQQQKQQNNFNQQFNDMFGQSQSKPQQQQQQNNFGFGNQYQQPQQQQQPFNFSQQFNQFAQTQQAQFGGGAGARPTSGTPFIQELQKFINEDNLNNVDMTQFNYVYQEKESLRSMLREYQDPSLPQMRKTQLEQRMQPKYVRLSQIIKEAKSKPQQARPTPIYNKQEEKKQQVGILEDQIRSEIDAWAKPSRGNIIPLLLQLDRVLFNFMPGVQWEKPSLGDLQMNPAKVKKVYLKATLIVHPDKVQQRNGSPREIAASNMIFDILKEGWEKYNK